MEGQLTSGCWPLRVGLQGAGRPDPEVCKCQTLPEEAEPRLPSAMKLVTSVWASTPDLDATSRQTASPAHGMLSAQKPENEPPWRDLSAHRKQRPAPFPIGERRRKVDAQLIHLAPVTVPDSENKGLTGL